MYPPHFHPPIIACHFQHFRKTIFRQCQELVYLNYPRFQRPVQKCCRSECINGSLISRIISNCSPLPRLIQIPAPVSGQTAGRVTGFTVDTTRVPVGGTFMLLCSTTGDKRAIVHICRTNGPTTTSNVALSENNDLVPAIVNPRYAVSGADEADDVYTIKFIVSGAIANSVLNRCPI